MSRAGEDLNLRDARLETRRQQPQLTHALFTSQLLPNDRLPPTSQAQNITPRRPRRKRPAPPRPLLAEPQQPDHHLQRRILDGRAHRLVGQMHLDVLIHARDDIVGPLGNGERAAGDEAVEAARLRGAVEGRHDVVDDVRDGGFLREAGEEGWGGRGWEAAFCCAEGGEGWEGWFVGGDHVLTP